MITKNTFVTVAVTGAVLAAAGLVLSENNQGAVCPIQKLIAGACCPEMESGTSATETCPVDLTSVGTTAAYQVSGLSDAAGESKLTEVMSKIAGVGSSSACAKTGLTKVKYDPAVVKKEQLVAAIQAAGFKLDGEVVELKVDGLDCAGCAGSVSKALTEVPGVSQQKVDLDGKLALVTFDPGKTSRETIIAAIDKSGFKVVP